MKKSLKKILIFGLGILFLALILFQITLNAQDEKRNYKKYGIALNEERTEIGLKELSKNWNYKYYNDSEPVNEDFADKIFKIFTFQNIETGMSYEIDSLNNNDKFFTGKLTWINSNILFWKNGITAEMDIYEKVVDSVTSEFLHLTYYFRDDNGNKNYYEANHYISKLDEFYCGTPAVMERERQRKSGKPYFGNITKKQADSILTNWNQK